MRLAPKDKRLNLVVSSDLDVANHDTRGPESREKPAVVEMAMFCISILQG